MLDRDPFKKRREVMVAIIDAQEFSALKYVKVTSSDLRDRDGIPVVL